MRKSEALNTFRDGLIMDLNPMLTPNTVLTDALNATITTNNGNEGVLQNDMGNAKVESTYLPQGYAPIGTCEFGGIVYILSYNPITKKSQIGSFPSPETLQDSIEQGLASNTKVDDSKFLSDDDSIVVGETTYKKISATEYVVELTPKALRAGDKYIIYRDVLDLGEHVKDLGNTGIPYVKVTPVSIEESGKITGLVNPKEYEQGEYNDTYFIYPYKLSTESVKDVNAYRQGIQLNFSIFSSKIHGKLGLKFELVGVDELSITWEACYHPEDESDCTIEYNKDKFDLLLSSSWSGNDAVVGGLHISGDNKYKQFELFELPDGSYDEQVSKGNDIVLNKVQNTVSPVHPYYIQKTQLIPNRRNTLRNNTDRENSQTHLMFDNGVEFKRHFENTDYFSSIGDPDHEGFESRFTSNINGVDYGEREFYYIPVKSNDKKVLLNRTGDYEIVKDNITSTKNPSNKAIVVKYNLKSIYADPDNAKNPYVLLSYENKTQEMSPVDENVEVQSTNHIIANFWTNDTLTSDSQFTNSDDLVSLKGEFKIYYEGELLDNLNVFGIDEYHLIDAHDNGVLDEWFSEGKSYEVIYPDGEEIDSGYGVGEVVKLTTDIPDTHYDGWYLRLNSDAVKVECDGQELIPSQYFDILISLEGLSQTVHPNQNKAWMLNATTLDNILSYDGNIRKYNFETVNSNFINDDCVYFVYTPNSYDGAVNTFVYKGVIYTPSNVFYGSEYTDRYFDNLTYPGEQEEDPVDPGDQTDPLEEKTYNSSGCTMWIPMANDSEWAGYDLGSPSIVTAGKNVKYSQLEFEGNESERIPTVWEWLDILGVDHSYWDRNKSKNIYLQNRIINQHLLIDSLIVDSKLRFVTDNAATDIYYWATTGDKDNRKLWRVRVKMGIYDYIVIEEVTDPEATARLRTIRTKLPDAEISDSETEEENVDETTCDKTYYTNQNELNKHDRLVYTHVKDTHSASSEEVTNYEVKVCYPYGYDDNLTYKFTVDWSKINSGSYDMNYWKYYTSDNTIRIKAGFELYPLLNQHIDHIDLEFYDNLKYYSFIYRIEDRSSYSGIFDIILPIDGSVSQNVIPNPIGHLGPAFDAFSGESNSQELLGADKSKDNWFKVVYDGETYVNSDTGAKLDQDHYDLYTNDAGVLYPINCYLVKVKVFTCSDSGIVNDLPSYIVDKVLWTNDLYNEKYYNDNIDDFSTLKPVLNISSELINTKFSSQETPDEYSDIDTKEIVDISTILTPETGDLTLDADKDYKLTSEYKATVGFKVANTLENSYDSFSISAKSNIINKVFNGQITSDDSKTEDDINFIQADVESSFVGEDEETFDITDDNKKYLTSFGETGELEQQKKVDDSLEFEVNISIKKENTFTKKAESKDVQYDVFTPIVYDSDTANINGLILGTQLITDEELVTTDESGNKSSVYTDELKIKAKGIENFPESDKYDKSAYINNIVFWHKSDTDTQENDLLYEVYVAHSMELPIFYLSQNGLGMAGAKIGTSDDFPIVIDNVSYAHKTSKLGGTWLVSSDSTDNSFYKKFDNTVNDDFTRVFNKVESLTFCLFNIIPVKDDHENGKTKYSFGITEGKEDKSPKILTEKYTLQGSNAASETKYFVLGCVDRNGTIHMTNTIFRRDDTDTAPGNMLLSLLTQLFLYSNSEIRRIHTIKAPEEKQILVTNDLIVQSEVNDNIDHGLLMNGLYLESYMNLLLGHAEYAQNIAISRYNTENGIVNGQSYNELISVLKDFDSKLGNEYLENLYKQMIPTVELTRKTFPIQFKYTTKTPPSSDYDGQALVKTVFEKDSGEGTKDIYTNYSGERGSIYQFDSGGTFRSLGETQQTACYKLYDKFEFKKQENEEDVYDIILPKASSEGSAPKEQYIENFGEIFMKQGGGIVLSDGALSQGDDFSYVCYRDTYINHGKIHGGAWIKCKKREKVFGDAFSYESVNAKVLKKQ